MAASSEIRFKIGADTSALSSAFSKVQSVAAAASSAIQKKFTLKDAFRGLMMGLGIGSVDAISDMVVRPFQVAMERAKDLVGLTARLRDISTQEIVAVNGRKTAIATMKKEVNDLSNDINDQQRLVASLDTPAAMINPMAAQLLRDAEQELVALKVRQAELQSKIKVETTLTKRATAEWVREQGLLDDLAQAELRDASDREKLQLRLNHLVKEYRRIVKDGNIGTEKERQNVGQQFAIQRQMMILNQKGQKELAGAIAGMGADIAGNLPAGAQQRGVRPRGRSEMERIASRGMRFREQAEEAIRTGKSPDFVASLASKANRDLTAAGKKVAEQTSKVEKKDAESLGGLFEKAVSHLEKIKENLTPTSTTR